MDKPLNHFIKPGLVHFMAYPVLLGEGPVLETLGAILDDHFFDVVEITWIKDPEVRAQARQMLETSGIEVKYGAQPRLLSQKLDLNHLEDAERLEAVQEVKAAVDDAVDMGIHDIGILSGKYAGEEKKGKSMDQLERSLDEICAYAASKSAHIVLEVFDQKIDKACLIGPAADAKEIAARVTAKHNNFGLMVDLSHIPLLHESPAEALQPVKEYVRHIHIGNCYMKDKDNAAYGDLHPRFGYPGGENDVPEIVEFLRELFEIGYLKKDGSSRAIVSFEVKPVGSEAPGLVVANTKRKLEAAWQELTL